MTRLRVLVCAFACHPNASSGLGSGEDALGWNLTVQIARFHDVEALTYAANRSSVEEALRSSSIGNVRFHYIDLLPWLRPLLRIQGGHQFYYFLWQIKAYFVSRALHKRLSFDLFHHITYANDWMASFIGALLPVPYIRGPGGGAHRTPRGFESEYSLKGRYWELIRSVGQWLFRRDPFFQRGQKRAQAILVCNRESRSQVPAKWSHKVHLFPVNGVSAEDLISADAGQPSDAVFRILSAGTLIRVKGFGLAIKAFKEFATKQPQSEFCIIGSGPEEPRLRAMVAQFQLQDRVRFLPRVSHQTLLSKMAACDVFLFPSLRDGGGAVVVEAMSAGKPVVCLDTGGPGMHVADKWGIKIAPTSPQEAVDGLAAALLRLYLDEQLRRRLGTSARDRAQQFYFWDKIGERLMGIYREALESKPGG